MTQLREGGHLTLNKKAAPEKRVVSSRCQFRACTLEGGGRLLNLTQLKKYFLRSCDQKCFEGHR